MSSDPDPLEDNIPPEEEYIKHSRYLKQYPPHTCSEGSCKKEHTSFPLLDYQSGDITHRLMPYEIVKVTEGTMLPNLKIVAVCLDLPGRHGDEATHQTDIFYLN